MTSRLRDHIERLDDGAVHAADDLAVVLRALVCRSKGNGVLHRLYEECGITRPDVLLSPPPKAGREVQFSVGSIPTREAGAVADGASYVPLSKWPNRPVLVVSLAKNQQTFTWTDFLNSYANKWGGAHLDLVVPAHLQFIDYYAAGGLSLTSYLLRSAAVETWLLAQEAYREIFKHPANKPVSKEDLKRGIYSAEGGVAIEPHDLSSKGLLQWFHHSTDSLGLLWYVDDTSTENALHIKLGKVSYDVRYTASTSGVADQTVPLAFQAPRRQPPSDGPVVVQPGELKETTLTGTIKTLSQVRAAATKD